MADRVVLDYHDCLLKESDLKLLYGSNWLNDSLIGFWFEYLSHEVFKDSSLAFVSPEVTQLVKLASQEDAKSIVDSLNLHCKTCVLLPINDSSSSSYDSYESGSHWSLLAFCRTENKYFHLDSMSGTNWKHASRVAFKLNLCSSSPIELPSLQQTNGWDCGIFVCCHAELLAQHALYGGSIHAMPKMSSSMPNTQRKKMLELIAYLSK